MPKPLSFGDHDFNLVTSLEDAVGTPEADTLFRMLVIGDFSGRANSGLGKAAKPLTGLNPVRIDRDTLDEVLKKLRVRLNLPLFGEHGPPVCIQFLELADFHPDALYQQLDVFKELKNFRKNLNDPASVTSFVEELRSPCPASEKIGREESSPKLTTSSLLDQIIEQSLPDVQTAGSVSPESEWGAFLHGIVKPYLVAKTHPKQSETMSAVDAATGDLMRMILHHNDFQALEAAWRGLSFLASQLETGSGLKLFLLDLSKEEFAADLTLYEDFRHSALYKLLVEQELGTAGGQPWSVVAGNYSFEKTTEDVELLGQMAQIAQAANISFVAAAGDRFFCKNSLAETPDPDDWTPKENPDVEKKWQALRHMREAAHLGLGLPRFLLRLPYGADTDPIDVFNFEEMSLPPVHEKYLWGNPCFAIMLLLGHIFSLQGRQMRLVGALEINSLPLHVYKEGGESHLKPCAEVMLIQRAAEQIIEGGVMPLLSFFNQDRVRLYRFQSIARPQTQLAGQWG